MRSNATFSGFGSSAFLDTNSRPCRPATHRVEVSLGARSTAARYEPPLDPALLLRLAPSATKSPHGGSCGSVYWGTPPGARQLVSRNDWSPPLSCVRHTCSAARKIVPGTFGSMVTGV